MSTAEDSPSRWVFAYGSLIFRPGFNFLSSVPAVLLGFERAFSQGSADHRGTPERPGRVLTLSRRAESRVLGVAFEVDSARWEDTLGYLDARESGGYERHMVSVSTANETMFEALTYLASPQNPNFLGLDSLENMAEQISGARGESGENIDYVLALDHALRVAGIEDSSVRELAKRLKSSSVSPQSLVKK